MLRGDSAYVHYALCNAAMHASLSAEQNTILHAKDIPLYGATFLMSGREYILNLKEAPVPRASGKGTKRTIEQATGATAATAPAQAAPEANGPDSSAPDATAPQAAPSEASGDAATQAAGDAISPAAEDSQPQANEGGSSSKESGLNDIDQQPGLAAQAADAAGRALQAGSDAVQSAVQVSAMCQCVATSASSTSWTTRQSEVHCLAHMPASLFDCWHVVVHMFVAGCSKFS